MCPSLSVFLTKRVRVKVSNIIRVYSAWSDFGRSFQFVRTAIVFPLAGPTRSRD